MRLPKPAALVDERFLTHRLRSSSLGGIVGGVFGVLLVAWRHYVDHIWSRDALAVTLVILGVKLTAMLYYRLTD